MRRARRGQCQIGEVRSPRKVPVMEAARSGAVEADGADQRMGIEQPVDRVWPLAADRGVGAGVALAKLANVPKGDPLGCDKGQPLLIIVAGVVSNNAKTIGQNRLRGWA